MEGGQSIKQGEDPQASNEINGVPKRNHDSNHGIPYKQRRGGTHATNRGLVWEGLSRGKNERGAGVRWNAEEKIGQKKKILNALQAHMGGKNDSSIIEGDREKIVKAMVQKRRKRNHREGGGFKKKGMTRRTGLAPNELVLLQSSRV